MRNLVASVLVFALSRCLSAEDRPVKEPQAPGLPSLADLAVLHPGWTGEVIARVDQSFAGMTVEIGDADNDGKNEVLTSGSRGSRLFLFRKTAAGWTSRVLTDNPDKSGLGLVVKILDLNGDGKNEMIFGTGETAVTYVFRTDGEKITSKLSCRPVGHDNSYTHNLAAYDLNGDGVREIISSYCGGGEVHRYDLDKDLTAIKARKIFQCSGSGEDAVISDVDNDGKVELIVCDCYRAEKARFHILDFDDKGELVLPPRITVEGYGTKKCFHCNVEVGDLDGDGKREFVVMWKQKQSVNVGTIIAYRIEGRAATPLYTLTEDDKDLDCGYGERLMHISDAGNDGKNELVVSTRGEGWPANGNRLGHVLMFKPTGDGKFEKTILAKFKTGIADSSWSAVGDADNNGKKEIVLATGTGDRTKPGTSWVVLIRK
jgi:hypothetical protein